jgi:hypothetical protein
MRLTRYHCVLALTAGILVALPLKANPILPGGTVSPDIFPNPGSVPLLNHTTGTFSFGSGAGLITGTYTEDVAVDPFGVTCSGCLDFAYQVSLNPLLSSGIDSLTVGRYAGYSTDVGYIAGTGHMGGNGGNGVPIKVHRGPLGGGLGFIFVSPSAGAPIGPGGLSAFLIVATDSKTYDSSGFLAISGGRLGSPANGDITGLFEPTFQGSAPEPSTLALLGLGVAGIAGFSRRRSKRSCL